MNLLITVLIFMVQTLTLYNFTSKSTNDWQIVDDRVMGGRSNGNFEVNEEGHGVFHGDVSTANNGGFSSVRMSLDSEDLSKNKNFVLRVKGDGKDFQFRVKTSLNQRHSYIYTFETTGDWQEIKIPFKNMFASWRGRKLDMPNYDGSAVEEMRFLIANKKNESFKLELDWISAK